MPDQPSNTDKREGNSELTEWWAPEGRTIDPEILERRRKVAIHWNRYGYSCMKSAKDLGVSATTIAKDRKWLLMVWRMSVEADIVETVSRECAKLDQIESELWEAWEASKIDEVMATEETYTKKDGADSQAACHRTRTTNRVPDVKIMDAILRCMERRARLLGLDKAVGFEAAAFSFALFVSNAHKMHTEAQAKKPGQLDVTPPPSLSLGK